MRSFFICLLFAACSVNPDAPELGANADAAANAADAGIAADAGVSPRASADAGSTLVPPADPPDCEVDADCPEGDVCRSGECRALLHGCVSSADCHEGAVCSTQIGVCLETCEQDSDCPESTRCAHVGVCLAECGIDDSQSCPAGTICKENRRIADFPYCGLAEDEGIRCGPGGVCPVGMGCNPETGLCDENHACESDRDCADYQLCNRGTGRCYDAANSCGNDRDCDEGLICHRELRRCTPPGWCETQYDCSGSEQCHPILEQCMDRCRGDRHCSDGQRCREYWCVEE